MKQTKNARADLAPEARDAEELVVGSLLLDGSFAGDVLRLARPSDFQTPLFRDAMQAIEARYNAGEPIDYCLITMDLEDRQSGAGNQAAPMLTAAITRVPVAMHAAAYAAEVRAASTRRHLIEAAGDVASWAYTETEDMSGLVAATLRRFEAFDAQMADTETGDVVAVLEQLGRGGNGRGYRTGIGPMDAWTHGIRPNEVITVAGYTGSCKTWATCQMANALVDQGASVCFFSVEMPVDSLVLRLLANRAGSIAMSYGDPAATFTDETLTRIRQAAGAIAEASTEGRLAIYHEQTTMAQIAAIVRRRRPDAVFIDYVQLLDPPGPGMREYEAVTANALAIQRLAQRGNCCMIMVSQVNEEHQKSGGASRAMGLKSSGAIGAVSDLVVTLQQSDEPEEMTLAARKNRHGPDAHAGSRARVRMDKATGRLEVL